MKDINKVILVGRLGADPIQRATKIGTPVTHFSVATTRKFYKEETNSEEERNLSEETQWHRVVTWGKQAEACGLYLKKGHSVYVEGFIRSQNYEDKGGQNKTSFDIQAETVSFLSGKKATSENQQGNKSQDSVDIPF
jgi:single-strand DNA-binding protein